MTRANERSAELALAMPSAVETRPKVKGCSETKNKGNGYKNRLLLNQNKGITNPGNRTDDD
jgi:hypothetical protein